MLKQSHERVSEGGGGKKERQPAGGGKTKGKVKGVQERWERVDGGRMGERGGRLSVHGAPVHPIGFWSCIKRAPG